MNGADFTDEQPTQTIPVESLAEVAAKWLAELAEQRQ